MSRLARPTPPKPPVSAPRGPNKKPTDSSITPGLHASFKLSADGEALFLADTDANLNVILDSVVFGGQETDRSYGRVVDDSDSWDIQDPTPGQPNR